MINDIIAVVSRLLSLYSISETIRIVHEESALTKIENVFDVLDARGFVAQVTDSDNIRVHLQTPTTCYIGFDPTADSLHIGHLVPILALVHMQRHGHQPIVLVGGGTGLVGDPSGKTEMRKLLGTKEIEANVAALKIQLSQFLDFSNNRALLMNNAEWLLQLGYIEFLRDIGKHFSINRMLAAESCRIRLETGLSFIEFNYMLLQAYDFYYLAKKYDCLVQMGGNDQWGNIVAGIELIRRKMQEAAFGITFPLLTTASGAKMGKTASGTVWLSADKTSPFDFYQYWVNSDDRDVERFLKLYTFLPLGEIEQAKDLQGEELNACKTILAYEVTALTHGEKEAVAAYDAAVIVFGKRLLPDDLLPSSNIPRGAQKTVGAVPTTFIEVSRLQMGVPVCDLLVEVGLCSSKSAARRLLQQGGAYVNNERIQELDHLVTLNSLTEQGIMLKAGKKKIHCIHLQKGEFNA